MKSAVTPNQYRKLYLDFHVRTNQFPEKIFHPVVCNDQCLQVYGCITLFLLLIALITPTNKKVSLSIPMPRKNNKSIWEYKTHSFILMDWFTAPLNNNRIIYAALRFTITHQTMEEMVSNAKHLGEKNKKNWSTLYLLVEWNTIVQPKKPSTSTLLK